MKVKYAVLECNKLNKSLFCKTLFYAVLGSSVLFILIAIGLTDKQMSAIKFICDTYADFTLAHFFPILALTLVGFLVSKEFKDKTILYVAIRSSDWTQLILGKVTAIMIYMLKIMSIVFFMINITAFSLYGIVPEYGDQAMWGSLLREILYFLQSYISILPILSVAIGINLISKNNMTATMSSIIVFFIGIITKLKFVVGQVDLEVSLIPYSNMIKYIDNDLVTYVELFLINILIELFFSVVVLGITCAIAQKYVKYV